MKTITVLCAIAYLGAAAPAPPGEVPEGTKHTYTPTHSSSLDILKREKKSPTEIVVTSLSPNMDTEFQSAQDTEPAERSFSLKKPLIVKKKHGYRLYRDSEEEKASADSYETCGRQVKVKLCDEDRKFNHPMRKFQVQDLHTTEEDVKHSIKMAKEAVENLQRDLKHIEHASGMKMAEASEADTELHEDIEVARQALAHIHENFGNLDTMNLRATTSADPNAMHDVRLTIAGTDEERMAQWKEALKNIDRNVEIAANLEKSFKIAGNEETSLQSDKPKPEMEINEEKVEENIGLHHKLTPESHTRASDEQKTDTMHKKEDTNQEVNDNKLEHIPEDDMKVSASQLSEVTGMPHKELNHRHLSRNDEDTKKIEEGDHHKQQQKSSANDMLDEKDFSDQQGLFSKNEDETASSSDMNPMFKSENSHDNTKDTVSATANLLEDQERDSELNEDGIKSEKNSHLIPHETEDIIIPLTKSAEQSDFTKPVATEDLMQDMAVNVPDHIDTVARESMQTQTIEKAHKEPMVHTGKSSEHLDVTSLDIPDQPEISMFVKSADLIDSQNHEPQTQKLHQLDTTPLKSAEENMDANNDMQATLSEPSLMRNVDDLETNLHNVHLHGLTPMKKGEELKQHFNMRQSHLTELPSIENVQDFTEDLHSQHMGINNSGESHLSDEELNHNFHKEHMPSMKSAEEHMNHAHFDHLGHSHLAHPLRATEGFETPFHIDHMSHSQLDDFPRMNTEGHDHMMHSMGMMHEPLSGSTLSHHHHDRLRQLNAMAKMREMSMGGGVHPKFHTNMRDAMEGFGSENRFRWQPAHQSARAAYGSGVSSSGVAPGAVGVFPNANTGGCGIPLLLSCSPSVVSGSLAKTHAGSSYSAPSYRSEDEFVFHNKRDIKNTNDVRSNNGLRSTNIIKQKTGTVLENKL